MAPTPPRVLVDAQAFQNPWSARRGIGRYLAELVSALQESGDGVRLSYMLNPDLPLPRRVQPLAGEGGLTYSDRVSPGDADVFHIPSPFEPAPIDRVWPGAVRALPLVMTVHDLIPFVLRDLYLRDPKERRWFRTRLELVRRASRVIAVSESTARDVVQHAGIPEDRVVVTGEGPPHHFEPAADRAAALEALQRDLREVRPDFVVYQGGMDTRKNIERLVDAYAGLPGRLRRRHQLVVVCELTAEQRGRVGRMLKEFDIEEDVLFPGYVGDETLVLLFQCAKLSVFPSLYEGFGLPVVEAIACRTPVIASRTSSIPELIGNDEALFDPYDPLSIRASLRRALEDPDFLERLRAARLDERHRWPEVAARTRAVYTAAKAGRRFLPRSRPRLAVALPTGPAPAEASRETYQLLDALSRHCGVDAFVEPAHHPRLPPAVSRQSLPYLDLIERARGDYDGLLSILDDRPGAAGVLAFVRERGGDVLLRDGALTRLYEWCARERPDLEPRGFAGAVRELYEGILPAARRDGMSSRAVAERAGLLMTPEVVSAARRVFVHSEHARRLVALDAPVGDAEKITVLPLAFAAPRRGASAPGELLAARVARVDDTLSTLVEALDVVAAARPQLELGLVLGQRRRLRSRVRSSLSRSGVDTRVALASESEPATWRPWLERPTVAVQLADAPELVVPTFVVAAIASGIPAVVSDVGPLAELPDDAAAKVPGGATPAVVAQAILAAFEERAARAAATAAHARANSVEMLADQLVEVVFG